MKHNGVDPGMEQILEGLRDVPLPDPERQAAMRAGYLAQARMHGAMHRREPRARWWRAFPSLKPGASALSLARLAAVVVLVVVMGSAGLAYAADGAMPGDALYPLDRAIESAQIEITRRPGARVRVLLAHASERLEEAEALAPGGDEEKLGVAWDAYGATIPPLMQAVEAFGSRGDSAQASKADEMLAAHEARWASVLGAARQSGIHSTPVPGQGVDPCQDDDVRDMAAHIARHYAIAYDDVASWMCGSGYGPGEVVLAVEVGHASGLSTSDMLVRRQAGAEWGQIYRESADDVHGREDPGRRDDTGQDPSEQPGDNRTAPGHGEGHGQGAAGDEGPAAESTPVPQGGQPEDAGTPGNSDKWEKKATPRAIGTQEDEDAPGRSGEHGNPKAGTPTPGGPGRGHDPKDGTPTPHDEGSKDGTPPGQEGKQPGSDNQAGEGSAAHDAGPGEGTACAAEQHADAQAASLAQAGTQATTKKGHTNR